jgi:hypothetical protein
VVCTFEVDGKLCVDGFWLQLIEEAIQKRASECRAWGDEYGAQALDRIIATLDDVPVPLMAAYIRQFEAYDDDLGDFDFHAFQQAVGIDSALLGDIVRAGPRDASEYVSEFLRRSGCSVLD